MDKKSIVTIIPAAGNPTNLLSSDSKLPDTMLPINGKPVIGYILEDLLERDIEQTIDIKQVILVLSETDEHTEKYVTRMYGAKLKLTVVRNKHPERGIGHSILEGAAIVPKNNSVLLHLGDTIYKGNLCFENSFLVTSEEYEDSSNWCFVEKTKDSLEYMDKPENYSGTGKILSGLYFFSDGEKFKEAIKAASHKTERFQISHILSGYTDTFELIDAVDWYDCGNIENYYRAKINFLKVRSFNNIRYNDLYGTITKTGLKSNKLKDEIYWYKNVPEELKVFSPRLIGYNINDNSTEYSLEYYGYQSLADNFVFNYFKEKIWYLIIDRLFEIFSLFKKHTSSLPKESFVEFYKTKTLTRVDELKSTVYWKELLNREVVRVNGEDLKGWPAFEKGLDTLIENIHKNSHICFVHGDPCLSNILFDPHSRIFKLIDPRGSFGTQSIYGDHNYDIAKLRHSFSGYYDFIVSDLFLLKENEFGFEYNTFHEADHEKIAAYFDKALAKHGYDLKTIKTIEALLFISMIPLHDDCKARQQAMFITGITLLNSLYL
jgi:UTP-glucose-1-phosphate uridylyltransferase